VALATTSKKKFKKGPKGGHKPKGEGTKDMSKFKCFACHKFGHYAGRCPNKKKKQTTASTEVEEFSTKFDKEFSLIVCLSMRTTHTDTWYIDSGASRHMTGVREHLTYLSEMGNVEVVLLFPKGSSITSAKVIGTRHERLYKFLFHPVS
jgi:hypothetical protein